MSFMKWILYFAVFSPSLWAQNNAVVQDQNFGSSGIAQITSKPFRSYRTAHSLALSDGSIVIGGSATNTTQYAYESYIVRMLPNGSVDMYFSPDLNQYLAAASVVVVKMTLDLQENILVVVKTTEVSAIRYYLLRVLRNGQIDQTFGGGGSILLVDQNFEVGSTEASNLAVNNNGEIYVYIHRFTGTSNILRFSSQGQIDLSYGLRGVLGFPDKKIVVLGYRAGVYTYELISSQELAINRYKDDGKSLDSTFGNNGKALVALPNAVATYYATNFQQNNSGIFFTFTDYNYTIGYILKLTNLGDPDLSFGAQGIGSYMQGLLSNSYFNNQGESILMLRDANSVSIKKTMFKLSNTGALDAKYFANGQAGLEFDEDKDFHINIQEDAIYMFENVNKVMLATKYLLP